MIIGGVGFLCGGVCGVCGGVFRGFNVGLCERVWFWLVEILVLDFGLIVGEDLGIVFLLLEFFFEFFFEWNMFLSWFLDVDFFGGLELGCRRLWVWDFFSEGVDFRLFEEFCGKVEDWVDNLEILEDRMFEVCDFGLYFFCMRGEDVVRCLIWDRWIEMVVGWVFGLVSECYGC